MGQLVFQAALGGQVNLVGPNTASTFNLNVPAASDTLVGRATTDTLTNKTLTSPVVSGGTIDNAVIGGTTTAAGSFTTLSYSSTLTGGTGIVNFGSGQFYKDASGNVGIGTASPAYKFDAYSAAGNLDARFYGGNASRVFITGGSYTWAIGVNYYLGAAFVIANTAGGSSLNDFIINSTGGVTITSLSGTGSRAVNASAAGLLSAASDSSLKEEVTNSHIAGLAEILQIHPKMYKWKEDIAIRGNDAAIELGFFANDVAPIIPSAAPKGKDGLYGFYDRSITAALVKAIQDQQVLIQSLTTRITALEAK